VDSHRSRSIVPFVVAGLLLPSGCTVGPKFTRPSAAVPTGWSATGNPRIDAGTAIDSRWWKAFNDPVLDRLVEIAYRQNLPLQVTGLRIVEARAQLGIATGRQYPQLQVAVGSATAVGLSETEAGPGADRHYGNFQAGFDAAWEMDFWGKYRRGVEAETAVLAATVADYDLALVSLTAEVARTYVTIRTFEVLIDQAQQNAKVQEQGLEIAQSRFRNGATSELDPSQATTLLQSTRATVPRLQTGLVMARNALSTALGRPPGAVDALLAGPRQIPRVPSQVAVGVPAEMLRRRADIRGAELNAAAQCARIGVAKADLYPSFSLFGTVGLQTTAGAGESRSLFSTRSLFYTVGPRIHWPFFNYGRLTNNVRVEDARFQQLLVTYRDTVLRAAQEVEDAMAGFLNSQEEQALQQGAVGAAQRSVELSLTQYREGATDYQRVLDAQRSLLEQQNALAQASSSVATSVIALYKSLGGGWEMRAGQPLIPETTQNEMKARTGWGDLLSSPPIPQAPQSQTGKEP
jgi:NodT family efflux transporter outer membrane factor (OMF) lipoprotein